MKGLDCKMDLAGMMGLGYMKDSGCMMDLDYRMVLVDTMASYS